MKKFAKKTVVSLLMICVLCLNLCSCGTNDASTEQAEETAMPQTDAFKEKEVSLEAKEESESSLPFKAADHYECVRTDTTIHDSGLVYTEVVDDMIYVFIQQYDTEKNRGYYEYCTYDMLEEEWTEPEVCSWSENLSKLGTGQQQFHRDSDGSWYCSVHADLETERDYLCKLNNDGSVEKVVLPEEAWAEEKDGRILNYDFIGDGKVMILLVKPGDAYSPDVVYKTCLMNIRTKEYELVEISKDIDIPFVIGDEFFCTSYTEESCGFAVWKKGSEQPVREMKCEFFLTDSERSTPFFKFPQSCQDEGDNLYIMYDDGIYGGYYKDKKLKTILNENMAPFMELSDNGDNKAPMISSFCRGTDTKYADFYALIANGDMSAAHLEFDYELAHIRAARE
ncbi:MAG: hypothetical protein NC293_10195 [Roseburia sp.]|nr:hypothetical protein [Roseburia sp.]